MAQPTLLDIAKMNGTDAVVGLIDEAMKPHPEIILTPARPIKGLNFPTLVRTNVPRGGSFRAANEGTAAKINTYERRLVETCIFNPRWNADKAVCDSYEDGAEAYLALEADGVMEGAFQDLCEQYYYGSDAKGFPGLIHAIHADMTVDAGGSTAKSSIWGVKLGKKNVTWLIGSNGSFDMDDPRTESMEDADGNKYTAYLQEMLARPGLQIASKYSVSRIKNLGTDSGKGLTDDLVYDMLEKWPEGTQPDVLFMNGRSLGQLRKSRTATNDTGKPAPIPESILGPNGAIPIKPTGAILNTES